MSDGGHAPARLSRAARLTIGCTTAVLAVGFGVTTWAVLSGNRSLHGVARPSVLGASMLVSAATIVALGIRFLRWQYLLRRLDVRLPAPESLGAFAGSFAFLPVPLLLGQLVARVRLSAPVAGERGALVLFAAVWERVLDAWALVVVAALTMPAHRLPLIVLVAAALLLPAGRRLALGAAAGLARWGSGILAEDVDALAPSTLAAVVRPRPFGVSVVLSLAAWVLVCGSLAVLAAAAGVSVPVTVAAGSAARASLVGAPSPLGVGLSGLDLLAALEPFQTAAGAAAATTLLYRAATAWLTLGVGVVGLVALRRRAARPAAHDHFDAIDHAYDAWLPPHYRAHLVGRKTAPMLAALAPLQGRRGLDVGCGRGWYFAEMAGAGAAMVGVDTSGRQLAAARRYLPGEPRLVQGSVLGLPFVRGHFHFAYIINVIHHLPPASQLAAIAEMGAVLAPGGLLFVHEMNVVNPLFRFYLGYVYPVLKGIEEGNETYLDVRHLGDLPGLALRRVQFFTFVPDFVPPALLGMLTSLERWLERGPMASWAAHFVAVYERLPDAPPPPGGVA